MSDSKQDIWSRWLLDRRFGGDPERMKKMFAHLYPIRDQILSHVHMEDGATLLDVGCGDGLIAFGVLDKFETCRVIFSDISEGLLQHTQALVHEMKMQDRCRFVQASADDLSMIADGSVDAVTTRSVLIYVSDKQKSFSEFYRVLKAGGELSIFEPINRFAFPEPPNRFGGYDVSPVAALAQKVEAVYQQIQPETDPMLDFDERDLVAYAEKAGFPDVRLDLQIEVRPPENADWSAFLNTAANPKIPSLEEALREALLPTQAERFKDHLRPLVESRQGKRRFAVAYLWAVK